MPTDRFFFVEMSRDIIFDETGHGECSEPTESSPVNYHRQPSPVQAGGGPQQILLKREGLPQCLLCFLAMPLGHECQSEIRMSFPIGRGYVRGNLKCFLSPLTVFLCDERSSQPIPSLVIMRGELRAFPQCLFGLFPFVSIDIDRSKVTVGFCHRGV